MEYNSIFDFLKEDKSFKDIYELCIQFEKSIINNCYNIALGGGRTISEFAIIKIALQDNDLRNNYLIKEEKKWKLKIGVNLEKIIKQCYYNRLIDNTIKEKYFKIKRFGNSNVHANDIHNFGLDECKEIHHEIFDIVLHCFNEFNIKKLDYEYDLENSNVNQRFTSDEVFNYLDNIHNNEINTNEFISYISSKRIFFTKDYFYKILNSHMDVMDDDLKDELNKLKWIDDSNIQGILNHMDLNSQKSIFQDLAVKSKNILENTTNILKNQEDYLTISEIDSLLLNSESDEKLYFEHIKLLSENFFYDYLNDIVNEFKNVLVQNTDEKTNKIINKLNNYEIIKDDYGFKIKQVDENIFLDEDQRKAVTYTGNKPLIINAGPGSGKTRVIVERVRFLIKNGADASSILLITFTNEATNEIKNRLKYETDLKPHVVNQIRISTVHSFCRYLLYKYEDIPYNFLNRYGEKSLFIQKFSDDLGFSGYYSIYGSDLGILQRRYDHYFNFGIKTKEFAQHIKGLNKITDEYKDFIDNYSQKTDGKFPEFNQIVKEKRYSTPHYYAKYLKFIESYPIYLDLLEKNRSCDDNYLLKKGYDILCNFKTDYTNILVDEFQDTDYHIKKIIDKLQENSETFTIVGDLDQSIYGFRGALPGNFKEYIDDKENNKYVELHTNYRSTRDIVEFNEEFINDKRSIKKELISKKQYYSPVYHLKNFDEDQEFNNLIYIIKSLKNDNKIKYYSDVLVLFKSNEKINEFVKQLELADIDYYINSKNDFLDQDEIKAILTLYWYLLDYDQYRLPYNKKSENNFLNLYGFTDELYSSSDFFSLSDETKDILFNLQKNYEENVIREAEKLYSEKYHFSIDLSYVEVFEYDIDFIRAVIDNVKMVNLANLDKAGLMELGIVDKNDLDFFLKLNELKLQINDENYHNRPSTLRLFEEFITFTNYYDEISLKNPENTLKIKKDISLLSNIIKNYESIMGNKNYYGLFNYLNGVLSSYSSSYNELEEEMDKVHVRTIHNSKGLEYPIVIIASLGKSFPSIFTKEPNKPALGSKFFLTYFEFLERPPKSFKSFHNDEEYRKIYVGATRAKEILILSTIERVPDFIEELHDADINFEYFPLENINKVKKVQSSKIFNKRDLVPVIYFEKIMKDYLFCPFRFDLCNNISLELDISDDNYTEMVAHNLLEIIHNHEDMSVEDVKYMVESSIKKHNISSNEKSLNIIRNIVKYWDKYGSNYEIMENNIPVSLSLEACEINGTIDLVIKDNEDEISIVQFIGSDKKMDEYSLEFYSVLYNYYSYLIKEYDEFKDKTINKIILHSLYNNGVHEFACSPNDEKQSIELLDNISSNILQGVFEKNKQNCGQCEFNVRFCKKK